MTIPGRRGLYVGSDGHGWLELPRNVDPAQDGTSLAAHHPKIFETDDAPDSVPLAEFEARLEALVPAPVLARMDAVIASGTALAARGLADTPPLDIHEWRRGMILSWSHARDLAVIMDALGHPRATANRHDVDEPVLAIRLKGRLDSADQWYLDYVNTLDEGAWVNVGFFNPHLSASMYKWGDAKQGKQNAMDAHRLSPHHLGNPETPVDWFERAANFVIHHLPREHRGIRHEARGDYSELEDRLATDPSIKNSEIGKAIARDVTALCELLEKEGKIVPWGLLAIPDDELTASMVEHAFLLTGIVDDEFDDDEREEHARALAKAHAIIARVPAEADRLETEGNTLFASAYRDWFSRG